MKQYTRSISPEQKKYLDSKGYKPFQYDPLPDYYIPGTFTYNAVSVGLTLLALGMRKHARRYQAPVIPYTIVILLIPLFYLTGRAYQNALTQKAGHRKTLEQRLKFNPISRNALMKSQKIVEEEMQQLQKSIKILQKKKQK